MRLAVAAGAAVAALALVVLVDPAGGVLVACTALFVAPLLRRRVARARGRRRRVWTEEERQFILERDGWACVQCGARDELQIDHIIPWSKGGACTVDQVQVLCGPCNRSKGAS